MATRTKETAGLRARDTGEEPTVSVETRVPTKVTAGMPAGQETGPTVAVVTSRTVTDATAPTAIGASPPSRPVPRALLFAASAAGLAALGVAGWLLLRPPSRVEPLLPPVVPAGAPATLALDAFPWGRVVSVRDPSSGRRLAALEGLETPRRLSLPPGRWEISVASGVGPEIRTLTVDLAPGSTRTESVAFVTPENALPLLE